jgi:hypothetical protein
MEEQRAASPGSCLKNRKAAKASLEQPQPAAEQPEADQLHQWIWKAVRESRFHEEHGRGGDRDD